MHLYLRSLKANQTLWSSPASSLAATDKASAANQRAPSTSLKLHQKLYSQVRLEPQLVACVWAKEFAWGSVKLLTLFGINLHSDNKEKSGREPPMTQKKSQWLAHWFKYFRTCGLQPTCFGHSLHQVTLFGWNFWALWTCFVLHWP